MTEKDWDRYNDPIPILQCSQGRTTDRKLRLFACACCRRIWASLTAPELRRAVEVAELFADQRTTEEELDAARIAAEKSAEPNERAASAACACARRDSHRENVLAVAAHVSRVATDGVANILDTSWTSAFLTERDQQARLMRHILGSPFEARPKPAPLPPTVVQLAEALYAGEDCSFALHDALLEAGLTKFAEHFRDAYHPKGCAWLDAILGKR